MWYIIKTDYYKERDAIADLLLLDSIKDIYFPNPRQEKGFRPAINGILFAYATDKQLLKADLNASGYFLRKEAPKATKAVNSGG